MPKVLSSIFAFAAGLTAATLSLILLKPLHPMLCGRGPDVSSLTPANHSLLVEHPPDKVDEVEKISEITLEHKGCYLPCPQYKVILRREGAATYLAGDYGERYGEYRAGFYNFDRLARLALKIKYLEMSDSYSEPGSHAEQIETSIVYEGRRKSVLMRMDEEVPTELWAFKEVLDRAVERTEWVKPVK